MNMTHLFAFAIAVLGPKGELATIYSSVARAAAATRPTTGPAAGRKVSLLLWDLAADKLVAELPTHPRNGRLDDEQVIWSADGRYLAYGDLSDREDDRLPITRIWDTQESREVALVRQANPVGTGPNGFLLASSQPGVDRIVLFDVQANKTIVVSETGRKLVHARGEQLLYIAVKEGRPVLCVARLARGQ